MVRLGKEQDDVEVINSSNGEWMFPFVSDAKGFDLSGPTGHHTGGEDHGCQGFAYMIHVDLDSNPAKFRYRKEMYHSLYSDYPGGSFTHSLVNYKVRNSGWNGFGWVRYNKPKGRKDGGDSVVLEAWWNPHPDTDITDWTMLKRVEDKGEGVTNWGTGGDSCNGTKHQVGTWSNIQFRFKAGASDFSLHPLIPEFEDGDVIHSIGGEDMDFEDTEKRGYGKRKDMPRDIEMKCLFKFLDDGECRFKNISLREIDPLKTFSDSPDNDNTTGNSTNPTEMIGTLSLKYDINVYRTSACSPGGSVQFYGSPDDGNGVVLGTASDGTVRTKIGLWAESADSILVKHGLPIVEADFYLAKVGSPTGTLSVVIRNATNALKATIGTLNVATDLAVGPAVLKQFINLSNTYVMQTGNYLLIEWSGGDVNNYVTVQRRDTLYETGGATETVSYRTDLDPDRYVVSTGKELAGKLWN